MSDNDHAPPIDGVIVNGLDRTLHQATRLRIVVYLYARGSTTFSELTGALGVTNGNANSHLDRLQAEGYVESRRTFFEGRPRTFYGLTPDGQAATAAHQNVLESIAAVPPADEYTEPPYADGMDERSSEIDQPLRPRPGAGSLGPPIA